MPNEKFTLSTVPPERIQRLLELRREIQRCRQNYKMALSDEDRDAARKGLNAARTALRMVDVIPLTTRTCQTCENEFEPKREWQVYCSKKCRADWHRGDYLEKQLMEMTDEQADLLANQSNTAQPAAERDPAGDHKGRTRKSTKGKSRRTPDDAVPRDGLQPTATNNQPTEGSDK